VKKKNKDGGSAAFLFSFFILYLSKEPAENGFYRL